MQKSIFFCYTCVTTKTRNIWCHLARFFPFPCDSNLTELVLLLRLVAMVHPHDSARTYGTMLCHGVDNSVDGGDKHLTHLLQAVDCCLKQRSKQNKHVVGSKDNGGNDSDDDSDDGGDKHLTHLLHAVDCCLTERSKQINCVDGNTNMVCICIVLVLGLQFILMQFLYVSFNLFECMCFQY